MRNVLLPVDGSRHAFAAVLFLIEFVKVHGPIEIHILNVEPEPGPWQMHGMEAEGIKDQVSARAHIAMKPILHAFNEAGIKHQSHVRQGAVAENIVSLAAELGCDTIVMGTRGLGGLAAVTLGSVTRKVLLLATLPVICVKAD
ncbi:MAG: universal stress protein [Dechloromonas sp.]|nr:universal stress protein [Dechloromonas sp.]